GNGAVLVCHDDITPLRRGDTRGHLEPWARGDVREWQGAGKASCKIHPTASLHALNAQFRDVIDHEGFMGVERLAEPRADQRAVVRILDLDEGIEVLTGREDFPGGPCPVELAAV